MLVIVHALSGAAIGSLVSNLPLVIILALISHYSLDYLPHLDQGTLGMDEKSTYQWATVDILVAALVIYCLSLTGRLTNNLIYVGAVFATLPDFLDNLPFFSDWLHQFSFFNKVYQFHERIQDWGKEYQFSWGIITQLVIVGLSLIILLR